MCPAAAVISSLKSRFPADISNRLRDHIALLFVAACLPFGGCDVVGVGVSGDDGPPRAGGGDETLLGTSAPVARTPGVDDRPSAQAIEIPWPPGKLDITFDDIKFRMKKDEPFRRSMLSDRIERLDGRDISIRGYILPSFQQRGIVEFVLVRDNLECCFGPGAALFDCILVQMEPGRSTAYTVRPVKVDGTFSIREIVDHDGKHLAIYHLSARQVD